MSCPDSLASSPEISIVIPFFNESEGARRLVDELHAAVKTLDLSVEILLVDDGSTDSTAEELERCAKESSNCRVIRMGQNCGQAAALFKGMRQTRAPVIALLDGDGQNVPGDLEIMLKRLTTSGADMVAGVRAHRDDSWLRRRMSRLANAVRSQFLQDGVSDTGCGLKVFKREVIAAFIPIRTLYSFMPALAVAAGFRVVEQPVQHRARATGVSKYGLGVMLWRPLVDMLGVWWFTRRRFQLSQVEESGLAKGRGNLFQPYAALGFVALVLFLFLGTRGLNEPDEGRYAEIGREMAVSGGDWLVPHLNGFEHFQKPPLLYWATAASIRTFGANEWVARLPSALAALGTVALTLWIGTMLFGNRVGVLAALILVSAVEFFALARLLTPDMMLTFWITAALACLVQYGHQGGKRWAWLFFAAMGLGFLTKGPMAFVVPISAALAWQFAEKRTGKRFWLPWTGGLFVAVAIGLSWFVALSLREPQLFDYFWRYELVERFASKAHGRSKPLWFFIPMLLVGSLPWTFLFPTLTRAAWLRLSKGTATPAQWLLLGWCVPPFLILSLSGSKLPTYILPLFPAIALALGYWLSRKDAPQRWIWPVAAGSTAVWLAAASLLPIFNDALRQQASVRDLAQLLRRHDDTGQARVFACEVRAHGLEFYLGKLVHATEGQSDIVLPPNPAQQGRVISSAKACEEEMLDSQSGARDRVYGIVRPGRFAKSFRAERWEVLGKSGDFLLIKNRQPPLARNDARR